MNFLPLVTPWLFWPVALLLIAAAASLLHKSRSAARWRYAALVVLVVFSAARPGIPGASVPVAATDLNVFFVVDTTPSVAAEDHNGSGRRIDGIKADISAIAEELAGASFSLLSFDSNAVVELPLTTDTTALRTLSEVLSPGITYNSQGSSISVADSLLAERLAAVESSHPERPRLVFYFGDGEQTAAQAPAPFTKSTALVDGGAVLGYGTAAGGKMREQGFGSATGGEWIVDKSAAGAPAVSKIDEQALRKVASELDVPYVHRAGNADIAPAMVKSAPGTSSQSESQNTAPGRWELYWLLAVAAFGVALWELASLFLLWRGPVQHRAGDQP